MKPINPAKIYYRISEVSDLLEISVSTIYEWERRFEQLNPKKTLSGHRRYTIEDINKINQIKALLRKKKVDIAREALRNYRKQSPRNIPACKSPKEALKFLSEVKEQIDNVHVIISIEAVERWIVSLTK